MVPGGGKPGGVEVVAHLLHRGTGGAIDDAALVPPLRHQPPEGAALVLGFVDVKVQVGTVEAGDGVYRVLKGQPQGNVPLDLKGGCSGKGGHHRPPGQGLDKVQNLQIAGPEVLTPLGNAVGLIHRHQGNFLPGHVFQKGGLFQPFRGDINEPVGPAADAPPDLPALLQALGTVELGRRNPRAGEGRHLIPHQGDQGGDHQGQPRQQQGRDLVAQGLSAAGGHNAQHVPTSQDTVHQRLLSGTEFRVAEVLSQYGELVHGQGPPLALGNLMEPFYHTGCGFVHAPGQRA